MCGIVGIVGAREPVPPQLITEMRDRLAHRGPDDEGIAFSRDGTTAFGHRRLAIIDPSPAGHQPMANPAGTLLLTYNGEIYNFRRLRRRLEEHGVQFQTRSDAEVLLKNFEHRGAEGIDQLRGMFAYAIWNEETRTCILARDRLGIKPLYYGLIDGVLYFASEATALLAAPPFSRQLDIAALGDYLAHGYVPAPRSIWRGIAKLPAGHQLEFRDGTAHVSRYWAPPVGTVDSGSSAERTEAMAALLAEAVELHTVSDVPVGTFLSGGLDSSTVTALMARDAEQPIRTYSIDFADTPRSEVRYARQVAERYATDHHETQLAVDRTLDTLQHVAGVYDEPLADESTLPTLAISAEVARHIKVVLSGDGGDEAFGGYAWYAKAARIDTAGRRLGALAGPLSDFGRRLPAALGSTATGRRLGHRLSMLEGATLENYVRLRGSFSVEERAALLPAELTGQMDDDIERHYRPFWHPELPLVRRLQVLDLQTYLPDDILVKVDRAAMHHALEVRVPFLDHKVVEAALELPESLVFRGGRGKRILRRVARDLVPDSILERPKQGFGLPRAEWERDGWRAAIETRLRGGELARHDLLETGALDTLLREPQGRDPVRIWTLLMLDLWIEQQRAL